MPQSNKAKKPNDDSPVGTVAGRGARLPVISSWDDEQRQERAFKDDGDMRLFSGSCDDSVGADDGLKLFKND